MNKPVARAKAAHPGAGPRTPRRRKSPNEMHMPVGAQSITRCLKNGAASSRCRSTAPRRATTGGRGVWRIFITRTSPPKTRRKSPSYSLLREKLSDVLETTLTGPRSGKILAESVRFRDLLASTPNARVEEIGKCYNVTPRTRIAPQIEAKALRKAAAPDSRSPHYGRVSWTTPRAGGNRPTSGALEIQYMFNSLPPDGTWLVHLCGGLWFNLWAFAVIVWGIWIERYIRQKWRKAGAFRNCSSWAR